MGGTAYRRSGSKAESLTSLSVQSEIGSDFSKLAVKKNTAPPQQSHRRVTGMKQQQMMMLLLWCLRKTVIQSAEEWEAVVWFTLAAPSLS